MAMNLMMMMMMKSLMIALGLTLMAAALRHHHHLLVWKTMKLLRGRCALVALNISNFFSPRLTHTAFFSARMDEVAPAPLLLRRHTAFLSGWGSEMIRRGGLRILDTSNQINQNELGTVWHWLKVTFNSYRVPSISKEWPKLLACCQCLLLWWATVTRQR